MVRGKVHLFRTKFSKHTNYLYNLFTAAIGETAKTIWACNATFKSLSFFTSLEIDPFHGYTTEQEINRAATRVGTFKVVSSRMPHYACLSCKYWPVQLAVPPSFWPVNCTKIHKGTFGTAHWPYSLFAILLLCSED